jgi:anti-sigma factor RsiW
MECASLERYLEAYLEGRLRRAQWLVLRRHVMTCPSCRARVEELRQFEVDLHQRFRAMARTQRLWTGLELDLVGLPSAAGSSDLLPPRAPRPPMASLTSALLPPPSRSRSAIPATPQDAPVREPRWSVVALLCLVLAGVSTGGWVLIRSSPQATEDTSGDLRLLGGAEPVDAARIAEPAAAQFEDSGTGSLEPVPVDLAQVDVQPAEVPDWLQVQLGQPVDLALPPDITLLGGSELRIGTESRPVVLAASRDDDRLMILPTVDGMPSVSADVVAFARRHGLAHMIRRHDGVTFDVLGSVPPAGLDELFFAPASSD